ncbi:MAG: hypothetical protein WCT36_00920 [Candidatus Gracilibacteria bacterium]
MAQSSNTNNPVTWYDDLDALGNAETLHIVNQLDKGLIDTKADPRTNEHFQVPGSIESVISGAIEVGDVDKVLAGMTDVIGTRLGMAAGFHEKKGITLRAIAAWKEKHAAELTALKNDSPKFQERLRVIRARLEMLNRREFNTTAEAKLAMLPVANEIRSSNARFLKKDEPGKLHRYTVASANLLFGGKPFTLKLSRIGSEDSPTKALTLDFETEGEEGPDINTLWDMVRKDEDEGRND